MDGGTVVLVVGLAFHVAGAMLLIIYGPSAGGVHARKARHTTRMARLGLTLILLGLVVVFAGAAVQLMMVHETPRRPGDIARPSSPADFLPRTYFFVSSTIS
ncbi:hypothetical protein BH24GEM1_BH24GEM1_16230 [soil metagenome]